MAFFDSVKSKFGKGKLKKEQIDRLNQIISNSISDGNVSDAELQTMNDFFIASELSAEDFQQLKSQAFLHVVNHVIADRRVNDGELNALNQISSQFQITPAIEKLAKQKIQYFRLFTQLENGEPLPVGNPANIILKKNEVAHLCIPGSLYEERVVSRQFTGSSRGISVPIVKGIRVNFGGMRGHSYSVKDSVNISDGHFVVTNQRLVFSGDRKSVVSEISKILDIQIYDDAFQFSVTNRQKPTTIKFSIPEEVELCAIVVSRIINQQ